MANFGNLLPAGMRAAAPLQTPKPTAEQRSDLRTTWLGLFAWLLYLNWKLTLIALAIAPPVAYFVRLLSRRLRSMARGSQHAMGDLVHVLEETIECHKVVKIFGGQDYEARRFERASQRLRGFNMRQTVPAALTTPVTHMLAAVALAIILYLAMEDSLAEIGRASCRERVCLGV